MIHLHRPPKPEKLSDKEAELTDLFIKDKKDVWNKKYIRDRLLEMSSSKCCYCETKLDEESKYMTVDHYHPKEKYPNEVVDWNNLLPSCSRCNSNKGDHNTYAEPIVNPVFDQPRDYFYLNNYRFRSKDRRIDSKARITIDVLGLNDTKEIVEVRFLTGELLCDKIDDLNQKAFNYLANGTQDIPFRNRLIKGIKNILRQAQPQEEYSGVIATVVLNDDDYIQLKSKLEQLGVWDMELEQLHQSAELIKFDTAQ